MEQQRPDPELLLNQIRMEDGRRREGQLKIFFGAAPGVGKTYAMLEAARQKLAEGVEVVAGLVETHGRKETEELLKGLETIPRKKVEYRGAMLAELDLDAALKRKPSLVLVDELAHTNAPGLRHKKRWQDIYELLGAGISVYTTLNVQHIESLNDVVAQITGIYVRETVPDFLLDRADEIELIDLPPDDLLQRLREGKVYLPELAERAKENFFKKGNLLALRELALRRTAESVDAQMQNYRTDKGVMEVWPAGERIMVCISPNPRSIRLIRAAKRMAAGLRAEWIAVNVEAPSTVKPSDEDLRRLSEHMHLAETLGAEIVTLSGHKASKAILNYARLRNVTKLIIGKPTHPRWKDKIFGSFLDEIVRSSGEIDIHVITGDSDEPIPRISARQRRHSIDVRQWVLSACVIVACAVLASLMGHYLTLVDVAMVYLLGIMLVASWTSKWPSFIATVLGIAAFDFFSVPPLHTFSVSDVRYCFTFLVMFLVAFVISRLTLRVREQATKARKREIRMTALYKLSRELVHESEASKLSIHAIKRLSEVLPCKIVILTLDENGKLIVPDAAEVDKSKPSETFNLSRADFSVAQWVFDHRQRAGRGTDTLPGAMAMYLPLATSMKTVGVLGILPNDPSFFFDQEQIQHLESCANQIAIALERALLASEAQRATLKAEIEVVKNTLLSSVSHDLRTPLAAITGAATAFLQQDITLDTHDMRELAKTICEEAEHLNEIIRNVLNMTRLESKTMTIKKEWQSLEEIVGVVLNRFSDKLKAREVTIDIPPELPMVPFDPLLIEQVLMNLLDNAIKYTIDGTSISLKSIVVDGAILVELADQGIGITPGEEERIFEKFVRGSSVGGGIGLGLTICRTIINAHGGHIWAENRHGGGTVFKFTLPLNGEQPMPTPSEET